LLPGKECFQIPGNRVIEHGLLGIAGTVGIRTQPGSRRNACKKAIIERALRKTGGNRAEAARLLDLNPKYFSRSAKNSS